MIELVHKFINTNGIRMHLVEAGEGPLVILCHGFPESWYSWRHQITALANAGFHVVAPDQRGYGQTDRPHDISAYTIFHMVGDIVGLVSSCGERSAIIVGHDWGAPVAWHSALLRPDIFRALGLLSVPYLPRGPIRPSDGAKAAFPNKVFYQQYFQDEGRAERDFERDIRPGLLGFIFSLSGDAVGRERWRYALEPNETILDTVTVPSKLPPWLTQADLDFFVGEFTRTGFRGGLNWYRNIDRLWELSAFLDGAKISQPAIFIAGEKDPVLEWTADAYAAFDINVPNLRKKTLLPGAGHWIQQERPSEVNSLVLEFLSGLR